MGKIFVSTRNQGKRERIIHHCRAADVNIMGEVRTDTKSSMIRDSDFLWFFSRQTALPLAPTQLCVQKWMKGKFIPVKGKWSPKSKSCLCPWQWKTYSSSRRLGILDSVKIIKINISFLNILGGRKCIPFFWCFHLLCWWTITIGFEVIIQVLFFCCAFLCFVLILMFHSK